MRLVAGLLLTAVLTGCAGAPDPAPPPAAPPMSPSATPRPADPSGSSSTTPSSPAASTPPAPAGPARREALPLQAGFAQPDPRSLVVQFIAPETCPTLKVRYQLTETLQRVSVRLTATAAEAGACRGEPAPRNVEIPLAQPLGDRELVDAGRGTAVQVAIGDPPGPPVATVSAEPE